MGERFAKYMTLIFIIIEIGMFTHTGKSGRTYIGPVNISEVSIYLITGLFYGSVISVFLVFFNPLMVKGVRIIGYIGAVMFVVAMTIYNHDLTVSRFMYLLGIISILFYLIAIIIEGYLYNPKKRRSS